MKSTLLTILLLSAMTAVSTAQPVRVDAAQMEKSAEVPKAFPKFLVPGFEDEMKSMRHLFHLHYQPRFGMGTLWDEWIPHSVLWADRQDEEENPARTHLRDVLLSRIIEPDGYVATHQHASIAHQHGWPFPMWRQGEAGGAWGWHFSLKDVPAGWHDTEERDQIGWSLDGGDDRGITDEGWQLALTSAGASIETPEVSIDPYQAPFLQLRWKGEGLDNAQPYLEWKKEGQNGYPDAQRFYFEPAGPDDTDYAMIPVSHSPHWNGRIDRVRVNFGNTGSADVVVQALFTQYDTRHNVNNQNFIKGSAHFFNWTGDLNFLRGNIERMRTALDYAMTTLGGLEHKLILTPFVGHEGRPGFTVHDDGRKTFHYGSGVGNNYWDLIPFGGKDTYATLHYYDALLVMADLEEQIGAHPEWNIPRDPKQRDSKFLREHAAEVKDVAGAAFWNEETGRFVSNIDLDGNAYDYGFTFVNLEAIHYGLASAEQAEQILSWISGERVVEGDTSQGDDIYRWRFGPRATTRRNVEYYGWFWSAPESIPWGGQVQDGGAVLGFSYHDLSSRLQTRGPDDAWQRLRKILEWFEEVKTEGGGYREYYAEGKRGTTLQGGGTAGGLGLDVEFVESVLLPQIMLYDFLGFAPSGEGFSINPQLPAEWPSLAITNIQFHDLKLGIRASENRIDIRSRGNLSRPLELQLPEGQWEVTYLDTMSRETQTGHVSGSAPLILGDGLSMRLRKLDPR